MEHWSQLYRRMCEWRRMIEVHWLDGVSKREWWIEVLCVGMRSL